MVKNLTHQLQKMISPIAFLVLIITIAYQNYSPQQDILNNLKKVLPETATYEKIAGRQIVYKAYKSGGDKKELLGYGAVASAAGYSGPVTVMVGIDPNGEILETTILENFETPLFMQKVIANDYLRRFKGKPVSGRFSLNVDIDRISGATYSSQGIAGAVRKAAHWVGESELGIKVTEQNPPLITLSEITLIGLYVLTFLSIRQRSSQLRVLTLALSFGFLGLWEKYPISFVNFTTLFSGNSPSPYENLFWFLLVVGVLGSTLFSGRNFYCYYMCPFGAVQEGLHKIGGFKFEACPKQIARAKKIRLPLAWTAFMIALLFHNHSIASYEPFSALFQLQANKGQWLLMPLVLFIGVFIYRFWCRFFCPVGAALDLTAALKRKVVRIWRKKTGGKTYSQ